MAGIHYTSTPVDYIPNCSWNCGYSSWMLKAWSLALQGQLKAHCIGTVTFELCYQCFQQNLKTTASLQSILRINCPRNLICQLPHTAWASWRQKVIMLMGDIFAALRGEYKEITTENTWRYTWRYLLSQISDAFKGYREGNLEIEMEQVWRQLWKVNISEIWRGTCWSK